jgi:hypothetical protein
VAQLQGVEQCLPAQVVVGDEVGMARLPTDNLGSLREFIEFAGRIAIIIASCGVCALPKLHGRVTAMQPQIANWTGDHGGQSGRGGDLRLIDVAEANAKLL